MVIAEDQPRWVRHFLDVKQGDGRDRGEFELQRDDGTVFQAQPIRLLAICHVPRAALDKAAPHWHKGKANAPLNAREHVEGPGFCQELIPGLRLSSV